MRILGAIAGGILSLPVLVTVIGIVVLLCGPPRIAFGSPITTGEGDEGPTRWCSCPCPTPSQQE